MMDMNKLDIVDTIIVENIYKLFTHNKYSTRYIPMLNGPIDASKLDTELLSNEQEMVDFIINMSLMLHDGPSKGDYAYMDIIYTKYEDEIIVCGVYQEKFQEYIIIQNGGRTILINGFKDEDQYFKFYNLVDIFKSLYYLK